MNGSLLIIFDKVLKIISGLVVGTYIARILGPVDFGLMGYSQSIVTIFVILSGLGLEPVFIKRLNSDFSKGSDIKLILKIRLLACVFGFLLFFVCAYFYVKDTKLLYLLCIFSILIVCNNLLIVEHINYHLGKGRLIGIFSIIATTLSLLLKSVAIFYGANVYIFSTIVVIESVVVCSLYWISITDKLCKKKVKYTLENAIGVIKNGIPLLVSGVSVVLYMKADQIMIEHYLGVEHVGIYNSASRLIEAMYFIPIVICNSLLPSVLGMLNVDREESLIKYRYILNKVLIAGIFLSLIISLFSELIIYYLYGLAYANAASVLHVYTYAFPFVILGVFSSRLMIQDDLEKELLKRSLQGCVMNLVLNYYLIPVCGIYGAGLSTLISQSYVSHFSLLMKKETRKYFLVNNKAIISFRVS
ncbi:flippase [Vibrio sp. SM6]|uniref:Flippase n=1 Tax=Vibrio agarilyticus TaxID=2726741 RepID=A0A7X8YHA6_9VIBR|nr:flippase [Vibrio agarilyticus]NLS13539.1 flippase [Vibrio agarilyticus]